MTQETPGKHPDDGSTRGLNSTEYRNRLLNKLNCLIAVLEVAIGKITKSMGGEDANQDRLVRIKSNLENTLAICRRAKQTLEAKLLEDRSHTPPEPAPGSGEGKSEPSGFRCYVELSSIEEFRKFKELPAITPDEIKNTDIDALLGKLLDPEA